MVFSSRTLAQLAGTTAVAIAFSPPANATPYFDNDAAYVTGHDNVYTAVSKVAGDESAARAKASGAKPDQVEKDRKVMTGEAQLLGRAFMGELEKTAAVPSHKVRLVIYPNINRNDILTIAALVPPKNGPITMCVQNYGSALKAWELMTNGTLTERPVVKNPEGSTKAACNATLMDAYTKLAQAEQQQKPIAEK